MFPLVQQSPPPHYVQPTTPIPPTTCSSEKQARSLDLQTNNHVTIGEADVGKRFPDFYHVTEFLGEGGFATVHRCTQKTTGLNYAVKIVDQTTLGEKERNILREEINILRLVREGPYIIRLFDVFLERNKVFMILEEMKGGDLLTRIQEREGYTEREVRQLCKALFHAVDFCHKKRIAHRDIKLANLLLQEKENDESLKLADFGLSKVVNGTRGRLKTVCGTCLYMAPEVVLVPQGGYDFRCDMWSVGVVVYVLMTGHFPFEGPNKQVLFQRVCKGQLVFYPEDWEHTSGPVKKLIAKLLEKRIDSRLSASEALKSRWISKCDDEMLSGIDLSETKSKLAELSSKENDRVTGPEANGIGPTTTTHHFGTIGECAQAVRHVPCSPDFEIEDSTSKSPGQNTSVKNIVQRRPVKNFIGKIRQKRIDSKLSTATDALKSHEIAKCSDGMPSEGGMGSKHMLKDLSIQGNDGAIGLQVPHTARTAGTSAHPLYHNPFEITRVDASKATARDELDMGDIRSDGTMNPRPIKNLIGKIRQKRIVNRLSAKDTLKSQCNDDMSRNPFLPETNNALAELRTNMPMTVGTGVETLCHYPFNGNETLRDTSSSDFQIEFRDVYTLSEDTGVGFFCKFHAATAKSSGQEFSVKRIVRRQLEDLNNEIEVLNSLRKARGNEIVPGTLVQLHEVYRDLDATYLVVQKLQGEVLLERLNRQTKLAEYEAKELIGSLLLGVSYCHSKRIAIRNLTLDNLLLSHALLRIVITDFEFAKQVVFENSLRTQCGMAEFVAPEVLQSSPAYDVHCDVWSVGVILYMMLSGSHPFHDGTLPNVGGSSLMLSKIIQNGDCRFPDEKGWREASLNAKSLLRLMLIVNPRDRVNAAAALHHSWIKG